LDRPRRRPGLLILAALGLAAAAPDPPPIKAMRWLAPGADASVALTTQPAECLVRPKGAREAWLVEVGRAAFRDPLVLGGQAARAGLACESCHTNGRTNPDFAFPGISGAPGTADVTSFLFSTHRGDHVADPRPIPDLGGPKAALKVSQDRSTRALEAFIRGLVTEGFDGPTPPAAVIDGLAAYVRAMDPTACSGAGRQSIRVADAVEDTRRAVRAGAEAIRRGDPASAIVVLQAARSEMGAIAERYRGANLAAARADVSAAALDLAAIIASVRAASPRAGEEMGAWLARSEDWAAPLRREEARSLYDRRVLGEITRKAG
jgi:hypothetical protein